MHVSLPRVETCLLVSGMHANDSTCMSALRWKSILQDKLLSLAAYRWMMIAFFSIIIYIIQILCRPYVWWEWYSTKARQQSTWYLNISGQFWGPMMTRTSSIRRSHVFKDAVRAFSKSTFNVSKLQPLLVSSRSMTEENSSSFLWENRSLRLVAGHVPSTILKLSLVLRCWKDDLDINSPGWSTSRLLCNTSSWFLNEVKCSPSLKDINLRQMLSAYTSYVTICSVYIIGVGTTDNYYKRTTSIFALSMDTWNPYTDYN